MKHTQWYLIKLRGDIQKISFTSEEAKDIARKIGIDFTKEKFDLNEFTMGINVELEHGTKFLKSNITNNDPILTGKIAYAHLLEFPDYYTRLKKLETEANDYCKTKL
ncbi:DUF5661 family protein [uncultured Clostridium sp.]|jgi:hypothetical protein|uniref:DUF5661 family protein n=1 Tax=Clostridium disporicum TaxID=84024 RepID=UPI0025DBB1DD|nr:DUF5661 family protein [uncultured Clostridium sp.]MDU2290296.1 DUF5661 family protein [Clostridium celatum]MDU4325363.1 DUF5661 family protein [Clostridium celatum]